MPPVFFPLTRPDGSTVMIDAQRVRIFRPTYGAEEPTDMTAVYFGNQQQFTPEAGDQLAERLRRVIAPARLTTPLGQPVWVDANKVSSVEPSDPSLHHDATRSVLTVDDRRQAVAEDVETAAAILAQASQVA